MHVVATAGHVDHGKSTLVRALTGMEPDRLAEEKRRGLTVDLGYAWTTTPSGEELAFVDVPGHRRFIGNMLAGIGPAPAVMFVVAADGGWEAQSGEHLAALDALGVASGLLVVTRADLADPAPALAQARTHLERTSLAGAREVAVSGRTGAGLPRLRQELDALVAGLPQPSDGGPVRLWIDRAFSVTGAGTVVTGTLPSGTIRVGDDLDLGGRIVRVRGLESLGRRREVVSAPARVAVNLRGVDAGSIHRGQALRTPGSPAPTARFDVALHRSGPVGPLPAPTSPEASELPTALTVHVGTASTPAHVRPLGAGAARLTVDSGLPLVVGDRLLLRDPGDDAIALWGARVVDPSPIDLTRRGDAARRGAALARPVELADEVERHGHLDVERVRALGLDEHDVDAARVRRVGDLFVAVTAWEAWGRALLAAVDAHAAAQPLDPTPTEEAARRAAGLPAGVLVELAAAVGLDLARGRVGRPGARPDLGSAEAGLALWEKRLAAEPFAAPEARDLEAAGLDAPHLAAAVALGRIVRLADDVVLLPNAPALAMRTLAALPQPFTTSEARTALGTTRRVAIPLLEHLDERRWTRRLDAGHREVRR